MLIYLCWRQLQVEQPILLQGSLVALWVGFKVGGLTAAIVYIQISLIIYGLTAGQVDR